jgi:peptidyl-prolyl cis-trans isomerase A (cyclophilin A)
MKIIKVLAIGLIFLIASIATQANATIVLLTTNFGDIRINLYDQSTPITVTNFLQYVEDGDYSNVIFHRTATNFVIQGGGFVYDETGDINAIPVVEANSNGSITNEPVFSNVRGTIAMAKLAGNANSASNQWFINLANNNALADPNNLDRQNGGFTVFGEVVAEDMATIDTIAGIQQYNFGGAFTNIPLDGYTITNPITTPTNNNLVIVSSISIIDPAEDTAANLNPLANVGPFVAPEEPDSSGGGGSVSLLLLVLVFIQLTIRRKLR